MSPMGHRRTGTRGEVLSKARVVVWDTSGRFYPSRDG